MPENDEYSAKETTKRMEDAIRRAMNSPHKPHAAPAKSAKKKTVKRRPSKPKSV